MLSTAGKPVREIVETCREKPDEVLTHTQIANLEPDEFMEFLDFCANKIHAERNSRKKGSATQLE